jgi:hypothetical protein
MQQMKWNIPGSDAVYLGRSLPTFRSKVLPQVVEDILKKKHAESSLFIVSCSLLASNILGSKHEVNSSETSVNYQITQRHIPEDGTISALVTSVRSSQQVQ